MTVDRDLVGRVTGALVFSAFLIFQVRYLHSRWVVSDTSGRINSLLIVVTVSLFLAAYLIRKRPLDRPTGFMQVVYPMLTSALPFVVHYNPILLDWIASDHPLYGTLNWVMGVHTGHLLRWKSTSTLLMIIGNAITFTGMLSLRRSFSILPEARSPVFGGVYRHIRHPLYLGEILATIGILLSRWSVLNVCLTVAFAWGQWVRSNMEERKLIAAFPEYESYREQTGRFLPKWIFPWG